MDEIFKNIAKYNLWDGTTPETGYLRPQYTSQIANYASNRLVKVLVG